MFVILTVWNLGGNFFKSSIVVEARMYSSVSIRPPLGFLTPIISGLKWLLAVALRALVCDSRAKLSCSSRETL